MSLGRRWWGRGVERNKLTTDLMEVGGGGGGRARGVSIVLISIG